MTQRVGIIGYPLGHSLSPRFQQAAFDHLGLDVRYEAWETPPDALSQRVAALRSNEFLGANVTVPHKEAVIPLLDALDDEAALIGAVNTIVHQNGRLTGHNTDGVGFLRALSGAGLELQGATVLLLGAGGAARAGAFSLAQRKVAALYIANRTLKRAQDLAQGVNAISPVARPLPLSEEAIAKAIGECALVVNATSVGMRHTETEGTSSLPGRLLRPHLLVCDLVYNPSETRFLQEARSAGAAVLGGLAMLVYQGAASFELWTGRDAPVEVMFVATQEGLRQG